MFQVNKLLDFKKFVTVQMGEKFDDGVSSMKIIFTNWFSFQELYSFHLGNARAVDDGYEMPTGSFFKICDMVKNTVIGSCLGKKLADVVQKVLKSALDKVV